MKHYRRMLSLAPVLLTACAGLTSPFGGAKDGVPVSLHGVNHTDRPFRFALVDPKDPRNTGGGEHIGPFGAGGIVCCYTLPKRWTPGIQVQVHATHWARKDANGKLPEIEQVHTVEVPPYLNGKAGELWVLRMQDGTIEVVSSDVQPNHPDWPGKVKGWPEPSIEYQRERWEIYRRQAAHMIIVYRDAIQELANSKKDHVHRIWKHNKEYTWRKLIPFTGPDDPAYAAHLLKEYSDGLKSSEQELEYLLKEKP